jgi:hypothetical protein
MTLGWVVVVVAAAAAAVVVVVIIGASGFISKSFRKYLKNILGKHDVKKLHTKLPYLAPRTCCEKY